MSQTLAVSIIFLDANFHGRRDGGEPEWPPSPLRLFQALVAASARLLAQSPDAFAALRWLETLPPPVIVAPPADGGEAYRLSVPNNAMDIVARAWTRGYYSNQGDANPSTHRAMKTVRPTRIRTDDFEKVHFLYELREPSGQHIEALADAARGVVALGWGVDLVACRAFVLTQQEAAELSGERWLPTDGQGLSRLRVPRAGTLLQLGARHQRFLGRLSEGGLVPVPPLTMFDEVAYRRWTESGQREVAAFQLLTLDCKDYRSFDMRTVSRVAAMTRHVVSQTAHDAGRSTDWIRSFVHGHASDGGPGRDTETPRFAYLPLPTIDPRGVVSSIRRVLVAEPPGGTGQETAWARRAVSGRDLIDEESGKAVAMLGPCPESDWVLRQYLCPPDGASCWSTVTPVVLPGFDDNRPAKAERLLRESIRQAGLEGLAEHATLEWRGAGFRPGLDHAMQYDPPKYLQSKPRYHVLVHWRDESRRPVKVRGPLAIGSGRFRGLGLFAVHDNSAGQRQSRR